MLISQGAQKGGKEGELALNTLEGYVSLLRGIPSPSKILFEKLTHQKDMLSDEQRLSPYRCGYAYAFCD